MEHPRNRQHLSSLEAMKKKYLRNSLKKLLLVLPLLLLVLYLVYNFFGKNYIYKIQDFKKVKAIVNKCRYDKEIILYKISDDKDNLLFMGERGEYIPCLTENNKPNEYCESVVSLLKECDLVFDNKGINEEYYSSAIHTKIPQIKDSVISNQKDIKNRKLEEANNSIIRKFVSTQDDSYIILNNQKSVDAGTYSIFVDNIKTDGEWVSGDGNKNIINFINQDSTAVLKDYNNLNYNNKDYKLEVNN